MALQPNFDHHHTIAAVIVCLIIVQAVEAAAATTPPPPPQATAAATAPVAAATAPLGEARGEVHEDREVSPVGSYRGDAKTILPASNLAYKAKDYWDDRFQVEQDYDVRPPPIPYPRIHAVVFIVSGFVAPTYCTCF